MPERTNRRDNIIEAATNLFIRQGYSATSVQQIADAVGCTKAALYYHFKEGKREILQAVLEHSIPDFVAILEACKDARSAGDLVKQLGTQLVTGLGRPRAERLHWITSEFPQFGPEERALFYNKYLAFHRKLTQMMTDFVQDEAKADSLAWVLMCAMAGYVQMFWHLDVVSVMDYTTDQFLESVANLMATQ